ncbi:hypothetical protein BD324DRAFT_612643 [Kockovaella imperatae]|uniref:Uncharacterized protein n=1 Tax=Kockovaella imperatae TaxID=4999 RepID=A0A1Y1USF0_9TREE|nr:hypothetical protein BD324DRAFT_612643 [Kockovaella imperatae]ORX40948.1 hypothetical protein BD324DRAFT_612643 [Kockovaella imperatae]
MSMATKAVNKVLKNRMAQYAPIDPYYEEVVDEKTGKTKKAKRKVPDGLSKRDAKALKKIRKRAHYLDKGMHICGFRVGWTFWIGIIPGAGDVVDAALNYFLVYRPAGKLDIPSDLKAKMLINNMVSAGLGVVPVVGDIGLAAWRANSRNALLLEAYLAIRAQEYLASLGHVQSDLAAMDGISAADLRKLFAPGSGMHLDGVEGTNTAQMSMATGATSTTPGAPPKLPARTGAAAKR